MVPYFLSGYTLLMYFLKNINVVLLLLFIIVQLSNNAKQHEKLNNIFDLYQMILNNVILRVTLNTVDRKRFTENFVRKIRRNKNTIVKSIDG